MKFVCEMKSQINRTSSTSRGETVTDLQARIPMNIPQISITINIPGLFTQVLDRWPYSRSQSSPNIAVCTPAFLANFIRGPNILEEELFRSLRQLVLDEVSSLSQSLL